MTYSRIIVPLDGSDLAEAVLPFAKSLALHLKAEVTLIESVNVQLVSANLPEGPLSPETTQRLIDAETDAVQDYLDGVATWLRAQGVEVRVETSLGPPASAIIDVAGPDAIVAMTTHGRSGLARFALGSVASLVVRSLNAPVLLVRPLTKSGEDLKRILVPLDGSGVAEAVVPVIEAVAPAFGAEVHLLMVAPGDDEPDQTYLQSVAERLRQAGVADVTVEVIEGRPAQAIVDVAVDRGSELIAMATHGRGGLRRWVFGSVADEILHAATLPVLLVRGRTGSK